MPADQYSALTDEWTDHTLGTSWKTRLKVTEKQDGTFRVSEQGKAVSSFSSLNPFAIMFSRGGLFSWSETRLVREYATREEAKTLIDAFDQSTRNHETDRQAYSARWDAEKFGKQRQEQQDKLQSILDRIPEIDRERYARERGVPFNPQV